VSKEVRVGIIGLGKMGEIRAREFEAHPDATIVYGFDPNPEKFKAAYPHVELLDSMQAVCVADVDAVVVCTPNLFTPDAIIGVLEAGKHVFSEKPPGRTVGDIERICETAAKNPGLKLKFGFNHRYHAGILEAKRIVDSGRLGKLLWARGVYGKSGGEGFEEEWRCDKNLVGAGILLDQGIHMLDLLRMFMGDFVEVKSMITTAYWDIPVEDNAFALLRNEAGNIAQVHSSSTQWKHKFGLELYLSDGYLSVNGILSSTRSYGDETITVARKVRGAGGTPGKPREETIYFDTDPSWESEIAEFMENVQEDTAVTVGSADQALKAMQLVFAIYTGDETFMKSPSAPNL
jgi:predicted dehydrogenase